MLCVVIGIFGAMWLIPFYVKIGTNLGATLGGMPGFPFCVDCTPGAGVCCWNFLMGYRCVKGALNFFGLDEISYVPLRRPL